MQRPPSIPLFAVRAGLLAIGLSLLFGASSASAQTTIADSQSEFSGTQGGGSWQYGSHPPFSSLLFLQLSSFDGTRWSGSQSFSTPYLDSTGGHPGVDDFAWAVRRWTAEVSGTVTISGTARDRDTSCGDGSHVRILQDGIEVFQILNVGAASTPYSLDLTVTTGQAIDFVIDPIFDTGCDDTEFTALITQGPAVPSITGWGAAALFLGLLAAARAAFAKPAIEAIRS